MKTLLGSWFLVGLAVALADMPQPEVRIESLVYSLAGLPAVTLGGAEQKSALIYSLCVGQPAKGREEMHAAIRGSGMAHEPSHLLLGSGGHDATDVMHTPWYGKESEGISQGLLLFASWESERTGAQILARGGRRETTPANPPTVFHKLPCTDFNVERNHQMAVGQATDGAGMGAAEQSVLTVLLYDYAGLPVEATRSLKQRTGEIMGKVGIQLEWVECSGPRVARRHEQCSAKLEPGQLVFRILAKCPDDGSQKGDVLGSAVTPGNYVTLCTAQILKIESDNWLDRGSVMPFAAAHEIGHLLLGPEHSASGIMRAAWGKVELIAMERLMLHFSASESETMRRAVWVALPPTVAQLPAIGRTTSNPADSKAH